MTRESMTRPTESEQTKRWYRPVLVISLILGGFVALPLLLGWFVFSIGTDGRQNGTAQLGGESRYPKGFPSFDASPAILIPHMLAIDVEKVRPESEINWLLDLALATESHPGVRAIALVVLADSIGKKKKPKSCFPAYANVCLKLLEDDHPAIRSIAVSRVCELGLWRDRDVKAQLQQIRDHDPDPVVQMDASLYMRLHGVE